MIETAVILAAGKGTRFGEMTSLRPKGFIPVNGMPMVIRSIRQLIESGIQRIIIGTGYHKEQYKALQQIYPQVECCFSEHFADTNSMWTLANCAEQIGGDDFLLLESDLIYERRAITALLENENTDVLLAAPETKFQDQYFVEFDEQGHLTQCSVNRNELTVGGEFVGIHKLTNRFYKALCDYYEPIKHQQPTLGYEFALLHIAITQYPLHVLKLDDLKWYEIDDEQDLRFAEKLFH